MMTSDDKVGGWVEKGQNHDDVILECPLITHSLQTAQLKCSTRKFFFISTEATTSFSPNVI